MASYFANIAVLSLLIDQNLKCTRRQVYRQRVFLPPPPLMSQCTRLYDVPGTHNVGLPTQYRFNVGPASQPIAGSILFDVCPTLKQNGVIVQCLP